MVWCPVVEPAVSAADRLVWRLQMGTPGVEVHLQDLKSTHHAISRHLGRSRLAALSPFGTFIGQWGLGRTQETVLINRITATVRDNVRRDLIEKGLNDRLAVRIVNSQDNPDIFGETDVSRVIAGRRHRPIGHRNH